MDLKKLILYLLEWLTPSCTAAYIILSADITWGTYSFWGYPINIPSYILASLIGAALFYYLNLYIFKNKQEPIYIIINEKKYIVSNKDVFIIRYNEYVKNKIVVCKIPSNIN